MFTFRCSGFKKQAVYCSQKNGKRPRSNRAFGKERMKHSNQLLSKRKKAPALTAFLLLALLLSPFAVSGLLCLSVQSRILTADEAATLDADAILVLGAKVWEDGSPSGILEDRLITALDLYARGASDRLLASGDHGQTDYDEVNAMKTYAVERGVPSSAVFTDHVGFSTYESLYRARDVFEVQTVIIVTQWYHLYRALYIARSLGLTAYGVASDLREYPGMPVFALFQPLPTYLGNVIPIDGDGSLTDG